MVGGAARKHRQLFSRKSKTMTHADESDHMLKIPFCSLLSDWTRQVLQPAPKRFSRHLYTERKGQMEANCFSHQRGREINGTFTRENRMSTSTV